MIDAHKRKYNLVSWLIICEQLQVEHDQALREAATSLAMEKPACSNSSNKMVVREVKHMAINLPASEQ
jgi:hypothetical protein